MSEANKAVVRRMIDEVVNQGRLDVADDLFSPEISAQAKQAFEYFRSAFPDWREDIEELVAEGNRVAARFKCSGTHRGDFMGMPPTGKRMEVTEVYFLTVVGGKIVDYVGVEDNLGRLQQLGLSPTPK